MEIKDARVILQKLSELLSFSQAYFNKRGKTQIQLKNLINALEKFLAPKGGT